MNKSRVAWKVGIFVFVGLVVAGLLILRFSKGASIFTPTYTLTLKAENVGGIIPGAVVLMAGVPVGNVISTEVDPDGKHVSIRIKLLKKYQIYQDATFAIKQAGFLGDRFISVIPNRNEGNILKDGDMVPRIEEPFDLQEVARSTSSLLKRVEQTVQQLNTAVARLDKSLLSTETLTNLTVSIANFRLLSERALTTVGQIDMFVKTNIPALSVAVTNFSVFSDQLNRVSLELQETVITNRVEFTKAVSHLEGATMRINDVMGELQQGHGLAGSLLKNEEMAANLSSIVSNFNVFSSNLNNKGLWSVVRKPKTASASSRDSKRD